DPKPEFTLSFMKALVEGGADIIELGVPFSDPMADGPVIQRGSERALLHGTTLHDVIHMVAEFRKDNQQIPVILMGYLNPIEIMGYENFAKSATDAGVDGVLIVDMPPEEAGELKEILVKYQLDLIFLISPTTSVERQKYIAEIASGFLYYVSLKGVTGSDKLNIDSVQESVRTIKQHSKLPVGVGFGIRDAESAASVAKVSDAIIVGSPIVELVGTLQDDSAASMKSISTYLSAMRQAIDAV
ncbi:MAG: tryptophan synthase subunit alpha, partial [Gammaproteobacteria bacterium]